MTNKYQRAKEAERGRRRRAEAKAAKLGITVEELPPRRPPMTNAERQRRFYKRQKDKMRVRGEEIKTFIDILHERDAIIKKQRLAITEKDAVIAHLMQLLDQKQPGSSTSQ